MRYADGPVAEADITIDAPADRVWQLVIDINLAARFSDEFRGARWLDPGPAVGARFVGRNEHPAIGAWETTSILTRVDPPRALTWAVSDPGCPAATWWYLLDELGPRTRLRHGGRMGPGPSGLTPAITAMPDREEKIVDRRLEEWRRNIEATLAGIKSIAEAAP